MLVNYDESDENPEEEENEQIQNKPVLLKASGPDPQITSTPNLKPAPMKEEVAKQPDKITPEVHSNLVKRKPKIHASDSSDDEKLPDKSNNLKPNETIKLNPNPAKASIETSKSKMIPSQVRLKKPNQPVEF